jgi:hypothetical protein
MAKCSKRFCGQEPPRKNRPHTTACRKGILEDSVLSCPGCEDQERDEYEHEKMLNEGYSDGDNIEFADPGGTSSLRAENVLTRYTKHGDVHYCRVHGCHAMVGKRANYCPACGSKLNQRSFPCPDCGLKDALTQEDVALGYHCNRCAYRIERDVDF